MNKGFHPTKGITRRKRQFMLTHPRHRLLHRCCKGLLDGGYGFVN
jgi:hypothetical protein